MLSQQSLLGPVCAETSPARASHALCPGPASGWRDWGLMKGLSVDMSSVSETG